MIREATLTDVDGLVRMGLQMRASTSYAATVAENPAQMRKSAIDLITQLGVVFVAEDHGALVGMIGLVAFDHFISGVPTVSEAFFWVDPEYRGSVGVRLLKAALAWATDHGAKKLQMIQPMGEARVGALYEALGFARIEVAWELTLTTKDTKHTKDVAA